ncbi:MAG: glycosyltransferase family 4 protein [Deltaproteobacteria bacterium]|nr:glycosyltransferase family 4 protein [Deltaproteobacteria bacterium]
MTARPFGVNALFLKPGLVGGTEVHLRELLPRLTALTPGRTWNVYTGSEVSGFFASMPGVTVRPLPVQAAHRVRRTLAEQTLLPLMLRRDGNAALLNLGGTALAAAPCTQVTFIHDLQYHYLPTNFTTPERVALAVTAKLAVRRSAKLIVPSEETRRTICETFQAEPDHIRVVPHGTGPEFHPRQKDTDASDALTLDELGIRRPYILSVAAARPHKHLDIVCDAFLASGLDRTHTLVMTGAPGPALETLRLHPAFRTGTARWLGWLPERAMPVLMRQAEFLAIASGFEGFCLPALEAAASGIPVAAVRTPPLPETLGSAARWVRPGDATALAGAFREIATDAGVRGELAQAGILAARRFSWEMSAKQTLDILLEAAGS